MKAKKNERLPRWKDCAVFGISGISLCATLALAGKTDAAIWFGTRLAVLLALILVVTAIRQRATDELE